MLAIAMFLSLESDYFCLGSAVAWMDFLMTVFKHLLPKTRMTLRDYFGDSLDTEHYYRHPRNYSRRAVFSVDEPSPTVRGVNRPIPGGYPGHHGDTERDLSKVRPLTTLERARIQTFPPSFKLAGSKTNLEQSNRQRSPS